MCIVLELHKNTEVNTEKISLAGSLHRNQRKIHRGGEVCSVVFKPDIMPAFGYAVGIERDCCHLQSMFLHPFPTTLPPCFPDLPVPSPLLPPLSPPGPMSQTPPLSPLRTPRRRGPSRPSPPSRWPHNYTFVYIFQTWVGWLPLYPNQAQPKLVIVYQCSTGAERSRC